MGELSSGRQTPESASLAPGTRQTLEALRDPIRQPRVPRDPLPPTVVGHMLDEKFSLGREHRFAANLRSSRRGAAACLSGMTTNHLRPLSDDVEDTHLFFLMGEQLAQARVPLAIHASNRQGRMIALQKNRGGVRGIVVGDVVRRLSTPCPRGLGKNVRLTFCKSSPRLTHKPRLCPSTSGGIRLHLEKGHVGSSDRHVGRV